MQMTHYLCQDRDEHISGTTKCSQTAPININKIKAVSSHRQQLQHSDQNCTPLIQQLTSSMTQLGPVLFIYLFKVFGFIFFSDWSKSNVMVCLGWLAPFKLTCNLHNHPFTFLDLFILIYTHVFVYFHLLCSVALLRVSFAFPFWQMF